MVHIFKFYLPLTEGQLNVEPCVVIMLSNMFSPLAYIFKAGWGLLSNGTLADSGSYYSNIDLASFCHVSLVGRTGSVRLCGALQTASRFIGSVSEKS